MRSLSSLPASEAHDALNDDDVGAFGMNFEKNSLSVGPLAWEGPIALGRCHGLTSPAADEEGAGPVLPPSCTGIPARMASMAGMGMPSATMWTSQSRTIPSVRK